MACEHQWHPQPALEQRPHIAGIGVVGVDPIGQPVLAQQALHQRIGQFIQERPKQFLAQVAPGPEGQTQDRQIRGNALGGTGVIRRDAPIGHQAGHHIHAVHLGTGRQGPGQFEHVGGLAAGVGIATQLQVAASKQTMQMQVERVVAHDPPVARFSRPERRNNSPNDRPSSGSRLRLSSCTGMPADPARADQQRFNCVEIHTIRAIEARGPQQSPNRARSRVLKHSRVSSASIPDTARATVPRRGLQSTARATGTSA